MNYHKDISYYLKKDFATKAVEVNRGEWQAMRDDRPQTTTWELSDLAFNFKVPELISEWQKECEPNLPWAEDHFQERIGGIPLNPGEEYKNWPWYEGGVEEHKETGRFSHTYMERMWPGGAFGNLRDLITLLHERPMTRQAFLTIWWPKDILLSLQDERVPCSLGYLFQYNGSTKLWDCYYYLRSCDFIRYMWDDIYMAGRLLQHVCDKVEDIWPGELHVKIANLHIFGPELSRIVQEYQQEFNERISGAF